MNLKYLALFPSNKSGQSYKGSGLFCFVFISLLISIFASSNYANATIYQPGETLEPDCAPTAPSCGVVSIVASATSTGTLTSTDWNTFNNKLSISLDAGKIFIGDGSLVHARAANGDIKPTIIKATLNSENNKYAGYRSDACEFS